MKEKETRKESGELAESRSQQERRRTEHSGEDGKTSERVHTERAAEDTDQDYERRRAARRERRRRELIRKRRRQKQIRLAIMAVGTLVILIAVVTGIVRVITQGKGGGSSGGEDAGGQAQVQTGEQSEAEAVVTPLEQAARMAAQYDYDGAINWLKVQDEYSQDQEMQQAVAQYESLKAACVAYSPEEVTHIFYHSLVVDPSKAFRQEDPGYAGWQQWMTTVSEFDKITQSMYDRGYVLVGIHDLITKTTGEDGTVTITPNHILLPEGKKPYVMSLDDLSYYHSYDDHGVASRLILDENGKITCEYVEEDGSISYGPYDVIPRLEEFLAQHPDASYRGARGIIALTGYDGIFGYRTDGAYDQNHNTNPETYFADELQLKWLEAHPEYDWETECEDARKMADALKKLGWEFANHTWGHKHVGDASYEELVNDTERWLEYVAPLVGDTDTIIFAHGQDIAPGGEYNASIDKYTYLKSKGFDLYCTVDSNAYTTKVTNEYFHQGRRNLDGYRIYQDTLTDNAMTADLFNANEVLDPARPLPVPEL